jgi:hypothetical protein
LLLPSIFLASSSYAYCATEKERGKTFILYFSSCREKETTVEFFLIEETSWMPAPRGELIFYFYKK